MPLTKVQAEMGQSNAPAFSASSNATQTITNNTFTKVTFGTEQFDTNSNFASSTFTPTVAGYYQVNYILFAQAATSITRLIGQTYKNGASFGRDFDVTVSATANPFGLTASRIVYMNGTTDYLEIYCYITATGTINIGGTAENTNYFSACLVRAA